MIKPQELESELPYGPKGSRACDVWDALVAAAAGEADVLRRLLARDPKLVDAEFWYTRPIHFAARGGDVEALRVLLEAGADPGTLGPEGEDLAEFARERGHDAAARTLAGARARLARTEPSREPDHPIHAAAAANDVERVRALLDAEPELVHAANRGGGTPLHTAVAASAREVVELLLDRGADVDALHGAGPGSEDGYPPPDFQPIDLALWANAFWNLRGDLDTARLLLARGAARDLVIHAALGELESVRRALDADPERVAEARPSGKRALAAAIEFGHASIARLLLERGADPNSPEGPNAPRGAALYAAARAGERDLVELLLDRGADPNGSIDSSGSAAFVAATPEVRALLLARGAELDAYDLAWLGEDDEVVRRVAADPAAADAGCGGVLAAACKLGNRDLVVRLLDAGARVPEVLTACRSYLLSDPSLLRLLLASGMDPDLPNWLHATPLHDLCGRDGRGRPRPHREECAAILLDAGASLTARDEDYRSTPLAWAARNDLPDMVELLLARGAPLSLPDDEPWATPLAWARRRGHGSIADRLRRAGA